MQGGLSVSMQFQDQERQVSFITYRREENQCHSRLQSGWNLLLGLFANHLVDLSGTINMCDGRGQLVVLSTVCSSISCTQKHDSSTPTLIIVYISSTVKSSISYTIYNRFDVILITSIKKNLIFFLKQGYIQVIPNFWTVLHFVVWVCVV